MDTGCGDTDGGGRGLALFIIDGLTVGCYGLVYGLGEEGWLGWGGLEGKR